MRGCLRLSRKLTVAVVAAALAAGGCSPNVLVAVAPCADGGMVTNGACTSLLEDLVGWWKLDEFAGSTIARDGSMYGNDGTLVDLDPAMAWVEGKSAGSLAVEGTGFGNVPRSESIDSIYPAVHARGLGIPRGDDRRLRAPLPRVRTAPPSTSTTTSRSIHAVRCRPSGSRRRDGLWLLQGPTAVTRQTWVHIAGTYDGTTARLYVDGLPVASQRISGLFVPDMTPVILGGNGNGVGDAECHRTLPGQD